MNSIVKQDDLSDQSLTSNSSDECPFTPDICSKLTIAFAKATGIDNEVAIQLLKDHNWNIDDALKATYDAKEQMINWNKSNEKYLKIFSWNTDTTDSDETELNDLIEKRTETMIEIILRQKPDVIFLQQTGTFALTLILTHLSSLYDDESIQIDSPTNCNYISIFTRKSNIKKKNVSILNNSENWKLLKIEIEYKNLIKIDLYNALIDEKTFSFAFEQINKSNPEHCVLFGISSKMSDTVWDTYSFDLNDLWEITGQSIETMYTFDPEINSNIIEKIKPQRYDRILFRSSIHQQFKPIQMEFDGIQHINTSEKIFPSTHWAIQGYFDIDN